MEKYEKGVTGKKFANHNNMMMTTFHICILSQVEGETIAEGAAAEEARGDTTVTVEVGTTIVEVVVVAAMGTTRVDEEGATPMCTSHAHGDSQAVSTAAAWEKVSLHVFHLLLYFFVLDFRIILVIPFI